MSPYLVVSLCAVFISLKIAGLLRLEARISTQLSMMSCDENEAMNAETFNLFAGHFVEFELIFLLKN